MIFAGQNRQLSGSISTTNFFSPQDDVGFKLEYVHPYILSNLDKNKTSLRVSAFNSRKLCPAFIGGPGVGDVPSIWVDRQGVKTALAQNYSAQSRGSFGLVLQEITTRFFFKKKISSFEKNLDFDQTFIAYLSILFMLDHAETKLAT